MSALRCSRGSSLTNRSADRKLQPTDCARGWSPALVITGALRAPTTTGNSRRLSSCVLLSGLARAACAVAAIRATMEVSR